MSARHRLRSSLLVAFALGACTEPPLDEPPLDEPPPAASAATAPGAAPSRVRAADHPAAVPGKYLVRLADPALAAGEHDAIAAALARVAAEHHGVVLDVYDRVFAGGSLQLGRADAEALAADPRVAWVEAAVRATGNAAIQEAAPWGLDRIDQPGLPLNGLYGYPTPPATRPPVHVYVVDTGVDPHVDLAGRIGAGIDLVPSGGPGGPQPNASCHDHGTHVAAIAAGATWGVAKQAIVHPVRVLDCNLGSDSSIVTRGLDWVLANHQAPAVVNLSLSLPDVAVGAGAVRDATLAAMAAGITVVASAGNDGVDACHTYPAAIPGVIAVGASDRADRRWASSNHGPCVSVYAPGVDIPSALGTSSSGLKTGTSMAAPHVTGAAALYLGWYPDASPSELALALAVERSGPILDTRFLYGDLPPVPRGVRASAGTCRWETRFRWDHTPGATYYHLWSSRYASFSSETDLGTVVEPESIEFFAGLRYVKVAACNALGCGPRSAPVAAVYFNGCL